MILEWSNWPLTPENSLYFEEYFDMRPWWCCDKSKSEPAESSEQPAEELVVDADLILQTEDEDLLDLVEGQRA